MDLKYNANERLKICNLQLPMQSVPNTTEVVSLNSANGKVTSKHFIDWLMSYILLIVLDLLNNISNFYKKK
jgi:hypothetical protein